MSSTHSEIKKNFQILKFSFYGLLKNLRFFEPYLFIYLLSININLFEIGILYSIKEVITYIFEVPSGIFADHYGRKTELYLCFLFYIISFIIFFLAQSFPQFIIAMVFFGLGEAFRSGTHKAMIYSYLEKKSWFTEKTFVYGRTRSYSLIGSSISAFSSIFLILKLPAFKWIFIATTIPYILNLLLIISYPKYLNEKTEKEISLSKFFSLSIVQIKNIFKKPLLINVLISSSLFDGIFATIKDYIQPILLIVISGTGVLFFSELDSNTNIKIILGMVYGIFYMFSSIASKNVYRLNKLTNSKKMMDILFDFMGLLMIILYFTIKSNLVIITISIFFLLYVLKNSRRPLFVDVAGDIMHKKERATVLSVDSQFKSLFTVILAPVFGLMAEKISIEKAFLLIGFFIVLINILLKQKK